MSDSPVSEKKITSPDQKELNSNCALCAKKKALRAFRPFCSKRCKDVDLGNWFTGKYAIPGDSEYESEYENDPCGKITTEGIDKI